MLPNSQKSAVNKDKKIRCGNYICFILLMRLLALPLLLDKTIAHTKGMLKANKAVQTNDVVLLPSPSQQRNFARNSSMKIISITPFRYVLLYHSRGARITANVTKKCNIQDFKVSFS